MRKLTDKQINRLGWGILITIAAVFLIVKLIWYFVPFKSKFDFFELEDGTYAVMYYDGDYPHVTYPSTYKGKPVTHICYAASTFTNLESAVIPEGITVIEGSAFVNCDDLESIKLPDGLKIIGNGAFKGCENLTEISIPESVEIIGTSAFQECTALQTVHIPANVSTISIHAETVAREQIYGDLFLHHEISSFALCTSLREITVAAENPYYCTVDGVLYSKDMTTLLCYPAAKEGTSFTVPETVTEIDEGAFSGCVNLEEIILPEHLTEIRNYTFHSCRKLQKLMLSETIASIGKYAFAYCESLTGITFPDEITILPEGVFQYSGLQEFQISDQITEIGKEAFCGCDALTELHIPVSVTSIGEDALASCDILQMLTVSSENPAYSAEDNILYDKYFETLLFCPAENESDIYFVPWSVREISPNAFSGTKIRHIVYPPYLSEDQTIAPCNSDTIECLTIPVQSANYVLPLASPNLDTCYDYDMSSQWRADHVQNPHHFMLALNGGWFNENWPEDKTLLKDGCTFLGWSTESCMDIDDAGALPEESGGKVYYAVFVEE